MRYDIGRANKTWVIRQFVVIITFIAIHSLGCSEFLSETQLNQHNQSLLQQIPAWARIPTSTLPASSGHLGEVLALKEVVTSRPAQVLSAGADGNIVAWSLESGAAHLVKQVGETAQLAAIGERKALVAWCSGTSVHVACLAPECEGHWELTRLKTRFSTLAFHDDDSALLIGGIDGRIYRWRFLIEPIAQTIKERDKSLERYIVHQTPVTALQPLYAGRAFFSADWDGLLYGWLAYTADDQGGAFDRNLFGGRFFGEAGSYLPAGRIADRGITALGLSDDSRRLAVGTDDGFVEIWEVRGFTMIARAAQHVGRVVSVSLNSDGSRVVSLGRDGKVQASEIGPDPAFGIAPLATRARLATVFSEEMKSARRVFFVSSGNVLVTTDAGQIGELALQSTGPSALFASTPTPAPRALSADSDY
jgi:hypothetical protein